MIKYVKNQNVTVKFDYLRFNRCVASRWQCFIIKVLALKKKAAAVKRKPFIHTEVHDVSTAKIGAHLKCAFQGSLHFE